MYAHMCGDRSNFFRLLLVKVQAKHLYSTQGPSNNGRTIKTLFSRAPKIQQQFKTFKKV